MPVISHQTILAIPRTGKRFIAVSADVVVCVLATWLAFAIRLEAVPPLSAGFAVALGASILFAIPLFITSGFYRAVFRYTGWQAFTTIYKTLLIYGLLYARVFTVVGIAGVPRSVGILQPLLVLIGINSSRSLIRIWLGNAY